MCCQDAQRRSMFLNVWTPMLTSNLSFHNKSLQARKKVAHIELLRGLCCGVLSLWPVGTDNAGHKEIFCLLKKRAKLKTKQFNDFREAVICNSIPDALRDLHTSKYKRPRNKPSDGCLWKPAKRNNVCTSKKLRFVASTETFNGNQALVIGTLHCLDILPIPIHSTIY